jgi:putative SOS response-associated peptidase YedK
MPTPPQYLARQEGRWRRHENPADDLVALAAVARPRASLPHAIHQLRRDRDQQDGSRPPVWFAFDESRPLAYFAGIWATWRSVRKVKEGPVPADLLGSLTSAPNAEAAAVHPKAMPVILTDPAERGDLADAPWFEAKSLQRPLPDGSLRIVLRGEKEDSREAAA